MGYVRAREIALAQKGKRGKIKKSSSYSVEETDSGTKADFTRVGAIGPYWEQEFTD